MLFEFLTFSDWQIPYFLILNLYDPKIPYSARNRNTLGKYDIFLPILFLVSFKPLKKMLLQEQPYACHVSLLFWHNATFLLFPNVYRGWDFFIP